LQAIAAITTLNGAELGGRRVLVREDREVLLWGWFETSTGGAAMSPPSAVHAPYAHHGRCPEDLRSLVLTDKRLAASILAPV